jgi:hypothetical protein
MVESGGDDRLSGSSGRRFSQYTTCIACKETFFRVRMCVSTLQNKNGVSVFINSPCLCCVMAMGRGKRPALPQLLLLSWALSPPHAPPISSKLEPLLILITEACALGAALDLFTQSLEPSTRAECKTKTLQPRRSTSLPSLFQAYKTAWKNY